MIDNKNLEPAGAFMIVDIISRILAASDDIDKLSQWLVGEIREMTGARLVLIFSKKTEKKQFEILHVSPERKMELCNSDEMSRLIEKSFLFKEIAELTTENEGNAFERDRQKLNFEINLAIPLIAQGETLGCILVLGLPDKNNLEMLKNTYSNLTVLLGLVFRNAHLIDHQENLIQSRTKELLVAKEHAEESDRLKSAFLANMSHEIRTPMNGILGFADLLKEPNLTTDEQREYIKIIEKSGVRMLNIINDIIDISKIESGLMKVVMNESNINSQIDYVYTFFKPEVERKGMNLILGGCLPDKEAIIRTDREKLFAILTNLVKNAIKYTNEGSIEFGYDLVETHDRASLHHGLGAEETHDRASLRFFVKDTGIGIPKDRQSAIFERFIQADVSDISAREGAGLGLAITKAYVEMLHGTIWVESEIGKGSTFYFTIPYDVRDNEKKEEIHKVFLEEKEEKERDFKLLIVDDDDISRTFLATILKKICEKALFAKNGKEAVELCKNHRDLDLILMDIKMPVLNGYEATQQIRQFNNDVVIIAQTAFGLEGDREKSIEAGCNDYLAKPIKKVELMEVVQKYLQRDKAIIL